MNTARTLQINKLLLAGLLAFIFLITMQLNVRAYEAWGGWSYGTKLIGGYQSLTIGNASLDSSLNIGQMPTPVTGSSSLSGGSQVTLSGSISSMGVASSYYRFFDYWGRDNVHHQTTETTGTATGAYSDTIEGVSTVGGFSYRSGVRVGTVYTYGSTVSSTTPYSGTSAIIQITPVIIWVALLIAFVFFLIKGYGAYKQGETNTANTFLILAVIVIAIDAILFTLVYEAIKSVLGG